MKALYRRALSYISLNNHQSALEDFLYLLNKNPDNSDINKQIESLKTAWRDHIGDSEYSKIKGGIEKNIAKAKNSVYSSESNTSSIPISEVTSFKKLKIIEETPNTVSDTLDVDTKNVDEIEFKHFWSEKIQLKAKIGKLAEDGKTEEAFKLAKETLSSCENYLSKLNKDFKHYHRLEAKIEELKQFLSNPSVKPTSTIKSTPLPRKSAPLQEEKINSATSIAKESIKYKDFPKNIIGFNNAFSSLKGEIHLFYLYLENFTADELTTLFSKNEISVALLEGIFKAIRESLAQK